MRMKLRQFWRVPISTSRVVLNESVLELTVLSLLAATCCLAASSLKVENFPVLFATLSLLAAIVALWRCLTTSR
jgi:hypothetical protein